MFFSSLLSRLFPPKICQEAADFIDASPEYILVDNKKQLVKMLGVLSQADCCTMDTEADSMYHYEEKICLIQISVGKYHYLVDTLKKDLNLKPLWKCKALKRITFHASDYDLKLLAKTYDFYPESIYDTSAAAKLLGEKQTGLAALVEKHFKVKLDKDNQKADWTKRPLSPSMCRYAVYDTVYLDSMRELQCAQLKKLGRFEWLEQCCENLLKNTKNRNEEDEPQKDLWRIKGANGYKPFELQLLKNAWEWRDKEAKKRDAASYRILNPYFMMDIVKAAAKCRGKITERDLPRLPRNIKGEMLSSFLGALNKALLMPSSEFPKPFTRPASPRSAINDDLREKLRELRNVKADKLGIDSGLLARQSQLNALSDSVNGSWDSRIAKAEFMPWQEDIWRELIPLAKLPKTPQEFRNWAKARVFAMPAEKKAKESAKIVSLLCEHPILESGFVAVFYPSDGEPDIVPFLQKLREEGRLLLPRIKNTEKGVGKDTANANAAEGASVNAEQTQIDAAKNSSVKNADETDKVADLGAALMDFVLVRDLEKDLHTGAFGLIEPKQELPIFDGEITAFVIPGVVFGKDGSRIGRGKGYYDLYLSQFKDVPRLGIAFSVQVRSVLPQGVTDARMNEVVYCK